MKPVQYSKHDKSGDKHFCFTILIPTWNNLPYLKNCIKSIRKNSSFNNQIIIVINEGNDGTLEWVNSQGDIDYIYFEKNIGICVALNICRSLVKSAYLVYINDDMYVCKDWDYWLDAEIKEIGHPYFYLSSTLIEPFETGNNCVIVKDFGKNLEDFNEGQLLHESGSLIKEDWYGSTWPPSVVHIDLWDMAGGLSIEFSPGFYSDPDFSRKLWEIGVRYFKGIGKSLVYHFISKTTKRLKNVRCGRTVFINKWGISAGFFTGHFLKKGLKYNGTLKEPEINSMKSIVNSMKRILVSFKRRRNF